MNLFDIDRQKNDSKNKPLAERRRPVTLDDFEGQEHLIGKGKPLDRLIRSGHINSIIFYGPPGTGKTTLAYIISKSIKMNFEKISAVTSGIKEIREVIEKAEENMSIDGKATVLFIDEIHRFNKAQQDALLPHVENGLLILIGATTENPFFSVNKALLSRCQILKLKAINSNNIKKILEKAILEDEVLKRLKIDFEKGALDYLVRLSSGDARVALNSLEIAALTTDMIDGRTIIGLQDIEDSVQIKVAKYDKDGDDHYNIISAFIKSIRGSDPNAALYYLAKMLNAGEDPRFISRRLMISASEDIGLADPNAINIAVSCFQASEILGMPEARIPLAEATIYLALAEKSNSSYLAIDKALDFVRKEDTYSVPNHLKDASYQGAKIFGYQEDYIYPHNYEKGYVDQIYLPKEIQNIKFYEGKKNGIEKKLLDDDYNKKNN